MQESTLPNDPTIESTSPPSPEQPSENEPSTDPYLPDEATQYRVKKAIAFKEQFEEVHMEVESTYYGAEGFDEGAEIVDRTYNNTYIHWLESGNNHLYTEITYPDNFDTNKTYTTVIMAHGYQSATPTYIPILNDISNKDCIFITFDFRGMGMYSKSDGSLTEMTLDTLIGDMKTVALYANELPFVDRDNLYLVGHSMGGIVAAITATSVFFDNMFKGFVMLAPAFSILNDYIATYTFDTVPETLTLLESTISGEFVLSCMRHADLVEEATHYPNEVLMIVDDEDPLVNNEDNFAYASLFGNRSTVLILQGADHFFVQANNHNSVVNSLLSFIDKI